jgi:hypothetical protein
MINVRLLEPGTRVALSDGSTAEIVSNPKDGIWVFARYLTSPHDASLVGTDEMVFAQDIVEVRR